MQEDGQQRSANQRVGEVSLARDRLAARFPRRFTLLLVILLIAAYAAFFSAYTIARHASLESHAYDLGNADQAVWNTAHGRPLAFTNWEGRARTFKAGTRLAMHVEPIYFLIAPLYWVWSDPRALLVLQATVVALGALPAYWLARAQLGDGVPALVFPIVYLLFPALQAANRFDFHAVTLASAFLLFAAYGLLSRRTPLFLISSLLAAATKEEIPLLIAMMGLYAAFVQRRWRLGLAVAAVGVLWSLIAVLVIVPAFNTSGRSPYLNYYEGANGADPTGTATLLSWALVGRLFTSANAEYVVRLLLPTGGLSLFSPATLALLAPSLAINLLSDNPQMHELERFHYAASMVPLVVVAAIIGTAWLSRRLGGEGGSLIPVAGRRVGRPAANLMRGAIARRPVGRPAANLVHGVIARRRVGRPAANLVRGVIARQPVGRLAAHLGSAAKSGSSTDLGSAANAERAMTPRARRIATLLSLWVLAWTLGYHYYRGFTPLAEGFAWPDVSPHDRRLAQIAQQIPPQASLSAQSNLNPHFSQRPRINLFPYSLTTDYVLLDAATFTINKDNFLSWVRDEVVNKASAGGEFGVVVADDGYILLQRGAPARPLPAQFYTFLFEDAPTPRYALTVDFLAPETGEAVLRLHGFDVYGRRGEERQYVVYLEALRPPATDYQIALYQIDAAGAVVGATTEPPAALVWLPTSRWPPGQIVRVVIDPATWWTRTIPEYHVALGIYAGDEEWELGARLRPHVVQSPYQVRLHAERTLLRLATLRNRLWGAYVEAPLRQFAMPRVPQPVDADLGGMVRLLGYDAGPSEVRPGEEVHVRLYWRARAPVAQSYTVFVHLLDRQEQVRGQYDGIPGQGTRPTDTWVTGEVIIDEVQFAVAPETPPGPHRIEVGLYLAATGARLPVLDAAGAPQGDRVLLPQIITVR